VSVEETESPQEARQGGLEAIGARLAAARNQQKLELSSVASQMHLSREVVVALEAGDAAALPAATFVRGYIKTYARLLGLNEQEILALLPTAEGYRPAPLKTVGLGAARRRRPMGKWVLWLLAACVAFVFIAYGVPVAQRLWTKFTQPQEEGRNVLALPSGADQEAEPGEPLLPLPEESSPTGSEEQVPEEQAPEEPLPEEQAPDEAPVSPEAEFEIHAEPASPPEASDESTPSSEPAPTSLSSGPAMVTLRFSQDSWVEMESHGRKLVVGIQTAGSERSVRAEPPIQLLLGNAPGVELEYRGKAVDLTPYQRGKVARLVLED